MIYRATTEIQSAFAAGGIKCRIVEGPKSSAVEAGYSCDQVTFIVKFISTDDKNDVAVRVFELVKAPSDRRAQVLEAVNELNDHYRFLTFSLDKDSRVDVRYDLTQSTENVGAVARELFIRFARIIEKAYPVLMKAIWT